MEADFKAIWNLPFLCPYLKHRIFIYLIIVIFMEQPKVFTINFFSSIINM